MLTEDFQGLTRFGRFCRRHPRTGRSIIMALLPVYVIVGAVIGAYFSADEAVGEWRADLGRLRLWQRDKEGEDYG